VGAVLEASIRATAHRPVTTDPGSMAVPTTPKATRPAPSAPPASPVGPASTLPPPVTNAEAAVASGEYARAVKEAYHRVVLDIQKAFSLALPAQWTHRQFLSDFMREDMGILTPYVARLYAVYEPVRYGAPGDWSPDDPLPLVRRIYAEPPMRDLYRAAEPGGSPSKGSRSPAPGSDGESTYRDSTRF
jgi:hypothetical protein